jgi:O-acetylserine/cysteine efflux transporter
MSFRDLGLLVLVCVIWASNNIVSKIVVAHWGIPPLFYATIRFAVIAVLTLRWFPPIPRQPVRVAIVALLLGAGNFALVFVGLRTASPSAAAVILQLGVPISTFMSVLMLGERIRPQRGLGIALTLFGALLVVWSPKGFQISPGLWFVLAAATAGSLGAIVMKQVDGVKPMQFQAWVGVCGFLVLAPASFLLEHDQWRAAMHVGWPFVAAVLYSALVVSILCHTTYYFLVQRYEANMMAALTLMTPLLTIGLGVLITHDHFDLRMALGSMLAIAGVLVVAMRWSHIMALFSMLRGRPA